MLVCRIRAISAGASEPRQAFLVQGLSSIPVPQGQLRWTDKLASCYSTLPVLGKGTNFAGACQCVPTRGRPVLDGPPRQLPYGTSSTWPLCLPTRVGDFDYHLWLGGKLYGAYRRGQYLL